MSKSPSREKELTEDGRKVFVTNIDGTQLEQTVQAELHKLFDPFGPITKLNVKKNKNGHYSFAFIEFEQAECAGKAIKELDQYEIFGKRMRVRQDRQSEGCFHCKRSGHFARECPQNKEGRNQPRQYHRNSSRDRHERHDRDRDQYRERGYSDRYYRSERDRHYRDDRDRRENDYRRRRSPSRSRSYSRQRHYPRDYSSQSRSRSYDRRRDRPSHSRHYHERDNRDRDGHRDEPRRRRSYSRSRSR